MDLKHLTDSNKPPESEPRPAAPERALYNQKDAYAAIIRSKILGEDIIVLKDKNMLEKLKHDYLGIVIYSPAEIEKMEQFKGDADAIRAVHFAKKAFIGRLY